MLKFVFITLEFSAATFSGNGIYARSQVKLLIPLVSPNALRPVHIADLVTVLNNSVQVRALASLGYQVMVLSGKPPGHAKQQQLEGALSLHEVSTLDAIGQALEQVLPCPVMLLTLTPGSNSEYILKTIGLYDRWS